MNNKHRLFTVLTCVMLTLNIFGQRVIDMEGYSDYSIRLDSNVVFECVIPYASIDVGPYTPCGDAPVFNAGYTFELNGHGIVVFEDLSWVLERDRESFLISRHDNFFYSYMLNNCNALNNYTIYCNRPNLKRLFVKRNFDGSEYVEKMQFQGMVGNYAVTSVIVTELPKYRRIKFRQFPDELVRRIKKEYRNAYGIVIKMKKDDAPVVRELHQIVFANTHDSMEFIAKWLIDNIVEKGNIIKL